jgi:hypothetical protein
MRLRASFALIVLVMLCVSIACSQSDDPSSPLDPDPAQRQEAGTDASGEADAPADDMDAASDAHDARADGPDDDAPSTAWLPATNGSLATDFQVDVAAIGEGRLDSVDIAGNRGSVVLSGAKHRGVAYLTHDWTSAGYTLVDFLSVAEDGTDLAVTYLYCEGADLGYAYTESFLHPLDWEVTTGTCDALMQSTVVQVELPALRAKPTPIDTGITISGTAITLAGGVGSVELTGKTWDLTAFNTVDCTDCPDGPWYELHTILERADEGCFGILYLFPDQPDSILLTGVVCLPSLDTASLSYDATWTGVVPAVLPVLPWRPHP